jgi:hypothetical protein
MIGSKFVFRIHNYSTLELNKEDLLFLKHYLLNYSFKNMSTKCKTKLGIITDIRIITDDKSGWDNRSNVEIEIYTTPTVANAIKARKLNIYWERDKNNKLYFYSNTRLYLRADMHKLESEIIKSIVEDDENNQ